MRYRLITLTLMSAFALGACGVKGDLATPQPLWGGDDKPAPTETTPSEKPITDEDDLFEDDWLDDTQAYP